MKDLEHKAQVAVIKWATLARGECPELELLFAIPNGGARNIVTATRLKAEGVRAGVPDLFLPVARGEWHGLFIEMKAEALVGGRRGQPTAEQKAWAARLAAQGYQAVTCWGSAAAMEVIREYLNDQAVHHQPNEKLTDSRRD